MNPGDVKFIPAGVKHWHGASHNSWFSHLAFEVPGEKWAANKELMIIPDAVHTDLYDNLNVIPFDKIADIFNAYLK